MLTQSEIDQRRSERLEDAALVATPGTPGPERLTD
jgi:hypothetical protein